MEPIEMTAEQFLKIRETLGLNQKELAERLGVTQTAISYWETGKRRPRGPAVILLRRLLERPKKNN